MSRGLRRSALAALILVLIAGAAATWWLLRPAPVVERLDLVGPETRAFATFLAVPEDRALREVIASIQKRSNSAPPQKRTEWIRSIGETLSGTAIDHVRATALVEALDDGRTEPAVVISLGRMAKVFAQMWFGISGSEREVEVHNKVRIVLGREKQDLAMAFLGNNLILSHDPAAVRLVIDRIKAGRAGGDPSERVRSMIRDVDPDSLMPGFGALLNDSASLSSVWRIVTGSSDDNEVMLPEEFEGLGFRFGLSSPDTLSGGGYAYFRDEESATSAKSLLDGAIPALLRHMGLNGVPVIEQEGRRLRIDIQATGVQVALDRIFLRR